MFEEITFPSPQILHIGINILKGGDFMAVEPGPARQIPIEGETGSTVADPKPKNSSFPERRGRIRLTRFDTAMRLVGTRVERDQIKEDWSLFNSEREMDSVLSFPLLIVRVVSKANLR